MAQQLLTTADFGDDPRALLEGRLERCNERVAAAARRSGRQPVDVELLVVSKYIDVDVVRILHGLGVRDFGENRVQEALRKREALGDLGDLRIHFIGHLQRNKARRAVAAFASIQSLDSTRLASELEDRLAELERSGTRSSARLFVEVNVTGEEQKTGLDPRDLDALLESTATLPRVRAALAGLMCMAPNCDDAESARPSFRRLREFRDRAVATALLPVGAGLSMGMSGDFEVAIEEGATTVRVGSALYGVH